MNIIEKNITLKDGRVITLETGKLAKQADGAVMLKMGNTMLLATVCSAQEAGPDVDFMPLSVDYKEKFSAVGRFVGIFQVFHSICIRNDVGQMEESGLHDHIDAATETDVLGDFKGINDVEFRFQSGQFPFHSSREDFVQVFFSPWGVQKEDAAWFEATEQVVFVNIGRAVASDVVSFPNQVRLADRVRAEAEMGNGNAAGFLGVVSEIALGIQVGVVTDDFDSALVGTDSTVGTEAPEFAGNQFAWDFRNRNRSQGQVGHIIFDGQSEIVTRCFFLQMLIHSHNIFRNHVFGT